MNTTETAFFISTDIDEEDLVDLAAGVDALDNLRLMIGSAVAEPVDNHDLTEYIRRAVDYLEFLRKAIDDGTIPTTSTMPIAETVIRERISRVMRSSVQEGDPSISLGRNYFR